MLCLPFKTLISLCFVVGIWSHLIGTWKLRCAKSLYKRSKIQSLKHKLLWTSSESHVLRNCQSCCISPLSISQFNYKATVLPVTLICNISKDTLFPAGYSPTIQCVTAKPVGLDVTYLPALLGDDSVVLVTLVRWVHNLRVFDWWKS